MVVTPLVVLLVLNAPQDRERAAVAFQAGQTAYSSGDYRAALAAFQEAYSLVPSGELLLDIGLCHRQLKDWAQARDRFERYLADPKAPNRGKVEGYLAEARAKLGPPAGPLPPAAAPQPGPSSVRARAEALTRRAIVEYDGGDFDEALADAKQAYALQPVPGLLYNLGQIHRALHHWEEAAFSYRAYLRVRPDAPDRAAVEGLIREMDAKRQPQPARAGPPAPAALPPATVRAPPIATAPPPAASSRRPGRTKVAVAELEAGLRIDPKLSHLVTTLVTAELRRRPALAVTSQEDIKAVLGFERQKTLLGCADASCLAEVGGALGVDQMVTGSLSRAGESLVLVVRVVDVHKGLALQDATRRLPTASEDALLDAIPGVAAELYPNALPAAAPAAVSAAAGVEASPSSSRSSAPWWLVGSGAAVAAVGGGLVAFEFASAASPSAAGVYPVTRSTAQSANDVAYAGQAALGVGGALLVSGALWALLRPGAPARHEAAP